MRQNEESSCKDQLRRWHRAGAKVLPEPIPNSKTKRVLSVEQIEPGKVCHNTGRRDTKQFRPTEFQLDLCRFSLRGRVLDRLPSSFERDPSHR